MRLTGSTTRRSDDPCRALLLHPVQSECDLGDRVLALLHESARGTASSLDVHQRSAFLYEFRDDLIVRVRAYLDRAEGLAAAGLAQ